MKLNDFKIICLNLEKRKDRKTICDSLFKKFNLDVEYFTAIDGTTLPTLGKINPGHRGCCLSHRKIYEYILNNNWEKVLILEDDVDFHVNLHTLFEQYYQEVPDDWKLLYFGGNHNSLKLNMITYHVHKLIKTYTTHCYALNRDVIPILLEEFHDNKIYNNEVDVHLSNIQAKVPCYGFVPHLAWQRADHSDILNTFTDYTFLR